MKIKLLLIFILSLINLTFCGSKKKINQELLSALLGNSYYSVLPYFSYPGRYSDPYKKREVLNVILSQIKNTQFSLKIYAYSLNHPEIISELVKARDRGVKIEITGDKDKNYELLQENEFTIQIWKQSGLHHIKVILSDNKTFFTGTGNFSTNGLTNDWNGYIQFEIEEKNRMAMQEFLDERLNEPVFYTNGIYFISSPNEGFLSQELLLEKINSAKVSIDYLIFDHFDSVMTHALKQATARGVRVTGVYDSPVDTEGQYLANEFYGLSSRIYKDGNEDIIETESFPEGGLLHHKTMIVDGKTLLSGSYNYSTNAKDSNREILFLTEDYKVVTEFQNEFYRIRDRSYPVPMTKFYAVPNLIVLNTSNLIGNMLCLPNNINFPLIEIGSGIWKTNLSYSKLTRSNCILLSTYGDISSGISSASKSDFFSIANLWNSYNVFDRTSNISYSFNSKESSFLSNEKSMEMKNPYYLSFTSNRIYFEMKEDLNLAGKQIFVWIPGKGIRSSILEKPDSGELGYTALFPTSSTERSYAGVFIETEDKVYFFCYIDKTKSKKVAFEYLSKRIFMKEKIASNSSMKFQSCIQN